MECMKQKYLSEFEKNHLRQCVPIWEATYFFTDAHNATEIINDCGENIKERYNHLMRLLPVFIR